MAISRLLGGFHDAVLFIRALCFPVAVVCSALGKLCVLYGTYAMDGYLSHPSGQRTQRAVRHSSFDREGFQHRLPDARYSVVEPTFQKLSPGKDKSFLYNASDPSLFPRFHPNW